MRNVFGANFSDGTNKLLGSNASYTFELSGSAYVNTGPKMTNTSNNVEMAMFLDNVFRVNGEDGDVMVAYDGSTWDNGTYPNSLVDNAPTGRYIHLFGRRMCVGYVKYASTTFPSRVWVSDNAAANDLLTWGLSNGSDLANAANESTIQADTGKFVIRNIKVGDPLIITSGSNKGAYTVSTITDDQHIELVETLTNAATGQSYWVGGNYIDVKTDDGDVITGLGDNSGRLLIFKRRSLHRWNGAGEAEQVKGAPGTPSHRSIVNLQTIPITCYFSADPLGIFVYDGTKSTNVSRGIQDYLEGIDSSNYSSTVGWRVGDLYKVYVGDITNTDKDISIPNAVIVFNAASNSLYFESYTNAVTATTEFVESSQTNLYMGGDSTFIYQLEIGSDDDGTNYSWYVETSSYYPSGSELVKQFEGIEVYVQRGLGATIQYKIVGDEKGNNDEDWQSLGSVTNNLTSLPIPNLPKGRGIRFRISREPINEPIILEKIDVFYTPLYNPFL